jgi:hypothetical protein
MERLSFFADNPAFSNEIITVREPAPEQVLLADLVLAIMSPAIQKYGFVRHSVSVIRNLTWIVFSKNTRYIAVSSSTLPVDFPYYYEVILGEGGPEAYQRQNRRSVTIAQLAHTAGATASSGSYDFPGNHLPGEPVDINAEALRVSILAAQKDLLQYGLGFLEGDLKLFVQAIAQWNKNINQ